ncbi:fimbrial protein [Pantoea endophytica]
MKMTKPLIASIFTTVLLSQSVMANNTGTVTFAGAITEQACTVPANQMNQQIDMTGMTPESLIAADEDESVAERAFTFNVTDCPAGLTNVGIKFDYNPDSSNNQYLSNSGTATGVAFGITDKNNVLKNTSEIINADNYDGTTGTATVEAKLRAYRVGTAAPETGSVESTATVTLITN